MTGTEGLGVDTHGSAPTLEKVAARAGVSRATVSRVVNGSPKVSDDIVARVRAAIEEMGYVPNRAARSLASRQAHAIALVIPEDTSRFIGDPFFASLIAGINERIEDSHYVLNLMLANDDPSGKTVRYLAGGSVDGALVVSHHEMDAFLDALPGLMPVVFGGRPARSTSGGHVVDVDNFAGARTGTERLIERGCERIATITGPLNMPGGRDRFSGWKAAIRDAGLEQGPIAEGDFTAIGGARAMRELLDSGQAFDGVFIASDLMSSGAVPVVYERGLRIPEDLKVVGYDDSPAATLVEPGLTTVSQPSRRMGWIMADILLGLLAGRDVYPSEVILDTELVVRETA